MVVTVIPFVVSLVLLPALFIKWSSMVATTEPESARSADSTEWSGVCIASFLKLSDNVAGREAGFWQTAGRTTLICFLLLGLFWPLVGWLSGKPMGFSDPPWQLFDQMMELLQRSSASQPSQAQLHAWASAARQGLWKYAYATGAIVLTACWGAVMFWCAGAVSWYLLRDFESAATWAQKSGLLLGLSVFTLLLLNVLTFLIGLVTSPAPWIAVILAGAGLGWWANLGLVIAANAFTFYFCDPWLKGLLLACLFPCLLPLVIVGPALVVDICRLGTRTSREKLLAAARSRFRSAFVPLTMTFMTLYVAYLILKRLL
jgi:hypothetical protein